MDPKGEDNLVYVHSSMAAWVISRKDRIPKESQRCEALEIHMILLMMMEDFWIGRVELSREELNLETMFVLIRMKKRWKW